MGQHGKSRVFSAAWLRFPNNEEEKEMLKKFGYSLVVVGALVLGVGAVSTALVGTVVASEAKCDKCGHAAKEGKDCKCECHHKH